MSEQSKWIYDQLFQEKIDTRLLDKSHPLRQSADGIVPYIDIGVDLLREPDRFPNASVNELMTLFWRLVGNRVTPTALYEGTETVSFFAEARNGESKAVVLVPPKYVDLCKEDPIMQLGGLVFAASQARDYYNKRLKSRNYTMQRAYAYEAEYLNTMHHLIPDHKPNQYQQEVLKNFPVGLASIKPELNYVSLPYVSNPENSWLMTRIFTNMEWTG